MVMMMSVTTGASRAGSTASFSSANPTPTAASTERTTATGRGSPAEMKPAAAIPPIITNSPWAKLMTRLAL